MAIPQFWITVHHMSIVTPFLPSLQAAKTGRAPSHAGDDMQLALRQAGTLAMVPLLPHQA